MNSIKEMQTPIIFLNPNLKSTQQHQKKKKTISPYPLSSLIFPHSSLQNFYDLLWTELKKETMCSNLQSNVTFLFTSHICNQFYPSVTLFSVSSSLCVPTSNSLITMLKLSFLYLLAVYEANNQSTLLQFPREHAPRVWLKFDVFIN